MSTGEMGRVFWWGGVIMLAIGGGLVIWALFQAGPYSLGLNLTGVSLGLSGLVFAGVGQYLRKIDTSDLLQSGQPAAARVLAVRDTGVTINKFNAVLELTLEVHPTDRPVYTAKTRTLLGRTQWGVIQPGMVLQVRIDRQNPQRIAIDSIGGQASPYQIAGVRRAQDIVEQGLRAEAVVLAVLDTGAQAGQLSPNYSLSPDQADDPVVVVQLQVYPAQGVPFEATTALRVPDGKAHVLVAGQRVPVAYLPDDPASTTTLHWDKIPTRS